MKKTLYQLGMFAAIALAFTACNKEADSTQNDGGKHAVTVTIGKQVDTKTAFGDTEGTYVWSDGDAAYLHVYENNAEGEITDFSLSGDNKVATLTVTFANASGPYTYTAKFAKEMSGSKNPYVQPTQSPTATSFDPTADVLISKETEDLSNLETRPASLTFTMGRVVTVNKLTLTNLEEGEIIDKVEISLDQTLYGYVSPDSNGGYKCTNGGKKLTIIYNNDTASSGLVPDDGSFPVYFVSAPVSAAGIESVVVTTDKNVYTKAGNTEATDPFYQKTITFAIGNMTRFAMDMDGFGEAIPDDVDYTLVSDEDMIADGGEYIIVSTKNKDGDLCAASAYGSGNSYFYTATDVTANDNVITIAAEPVMVFTLEAGSTAGQFYIKDGDGKYIFWETSGNNVKRGAKGTTNAYLWTVEPDAITNVGTDTRLLQYNAGSPRFACYTGSQTAISLYVNASTITQLANPELSFSTSEVEVVWEVDHWGDFSQPVLNNPHNLPITWTSSDPDVASFEDDVLTLNGNGTTTITASSEKTDTYSAGSASYTLTLSGAPVKGSAELPFTVAEARAFIDGLTSKPTATEYYVTGTVSKIVNQFGSNQYGHATFDISADGLTTSDQFRAYHVLYLENKAWTSGDQTVGVGDEVVVCGRLTTYGSGTSLVYETYSATGDNAYNGYLVSLDKAPYFTAAISDNIITSEGGNAITLTIESNVEWTATIDDDDTPDTNGATLQYGEVPEGRSVSGEGDAVITVIIPENAAGATYTISFSSEQITITDTKTITQSPSGESPKGSEENPYTIAEALEIIEGLTAGNDGRTENEVCVSGIISEVKEYFSKYHSITYCITEDGTASDEYIQVYSGKGLNGADFSSINDLHVGYEVVVKGHLMKFISGDTTVPEIYQSSSLVSMTETPHFTAELSNDVIAYTGGNSITLTISANVPWGASIDNSASLQVGGITSASVSGTEDAVITVLIPENQNGATYTISFTTESTKINAPGDLQITQNANSGHSWTLVNALADIAGGTYTIAAYYDSKYYTVPNTTINAQTFTCIEATYSATDGLTLPNGAGQFVFTPVTGVNNAFYIYNTNLEKYLVATGSKKFGYVDNKSSDYGYWTFSTVSSGGFSGVFSVQHSSKTQYMRAYNNLVRCYDGASNSGIYLFVYN